MNSGGMVLFLRMCLIIFAAVTLRGAELQIIATGDIHGRMYDFARLAPVIKRYPDAVKIDLGDLFHGDPVCDFTAGIPMIEALNHLKYDIFICGNHEFELAPETFVNTFSRFNGILLGQFRVGKLKTMPWKLIERNGFRCAVIGMTDNGVFRNRKFHPGVQIIEELTALKQALAEIRKYQVDAVVLARHGGDYFSGVPAGQVLYQHPEIDLMICGHTHKEIAGMRRGRVLIVQPGNFAGSAILVSMRKNPGKPLLIQSRLLRPGKDVDRTVSGIRRRAYAAAHPVLNAPLNAPGSSREFAAKLLEKLRQLAGTDCAAVDLPVLMPGEMTVKDFLRIFPYRNMLTVVECTPEEYRKFCRERVPAKRERFATALPPGRSSFTLVLNTFMLSRSKSPGAGKACRMLPVIERDVIGEILGCPPDAVGQKGAL